MDLGNRTRQEEHYVRALTLREELVQPADDIPDYLQALAQSYNNLGVFHGGDSNVTEQENYYLKSVDARRKLTQLEPEVPDYQSRLTLSLKNLGLLYLRTGQNDKAEPTLREALASQEKLTAAHGDNPENVRTLAACHVALSTWQHRVGKEEDAIASADRALQLLSPLVQKEERHIEMREILADAYKGRAEAHIQQGKYDEALRDCDAGLLRRRRPSRRPAPAACKRACPARRPCRRRGGGRDGGPAQAAQRPDLPCRRSFTRWPRRQPGRTIGCCLPSGQRSPSKPPSVPWSFWRRRRRPAISATRSGSAKWTGSRTWRHCAPGRIIAGFGREWSNDWPVLRAALPSTQIMEQAVRRPRLGATRRPDRSAADSRSDDDRSSNRPGTG